MCQPTPCVTVASHSHNSVRSPSRRRLMLPLLGVVASQHSPGWPETQRIVSKRKHKEYHRESRRRIGNLIKDSVTPEAAALIDESGDQNFFFCHPLIAVDATLSNDFFEWPPPRQISPPKQQISDRIGK